MGRAGWLTACFGVLLVTTPARAGSEDELTLDLGERSSLDLRRIPAGAFVQGSPPSEAGREPDETPRKVTLTRAYWLGKVPVTRGQFSLFVSETRHLTDAEKAQSGGLGFDPKTGQLAQKKDATWRNPGFPQKEEDPVVLVTFGDASAFAAWASRKTNRRIRLPTEAEWENAARGRTTTPWYGATKDEEALSLGWFKANATSSTHPVGLRKPNPFGLFEMTGNVQQWCRDVYAPYPAADATDPENATNATTEPERRVMRGGSWYRDPKRGRSASRHKSAPGTRSSELGFRVAMEDDPAATLAPAPSGEAAPGNPAALADASATAAPFTPPPVPRSEGMTWVLLAAPAAASGFSVAWVLARRRSKAKTPLTTRAHDDGFWIRAAGLPAGTRVRYACIVGGVEVTDIVVLEGGDETFVLTGQAPAAIRITEVIPLPRESVVPRAPLWPTVGPTSLPLRTRPALLVGPSAKDESPRSPVSTPGYDGPRSSVPRVPVGLPPPPSVPVVPVARPASAESMLDDRIGDSSPSLSIPLSLPPAAIALPASPSPPAVDLAKPATDEAEVDDAARTHELPQHSSVPLDHDALRAAVPAPAESTAALPAAVERTAALPVVDSTAVLPISSSVKSVPPATASVKSVPPAAASVKSVPPATASVKSVPPAAASVKSVPPAPSSVVPAARPSAPPIAPTPFRMTPSAAPPATTTALLPPPTLTLPTTTALLPPPMGGALPESPAPTKTALLPPPILSPKEEISPVAVTPAEVSAPFPLTPSAAPPANPVKSDETASPPAASTPFAVTPSVGPPAPSTPKSLPPAASSSKPITANTPDAPSAPPSEPKAAEASVDASKPPASERLPEEPD